MAKLNVFKRENSVCMTLMKTLLLITTLNMILFDATSAAKTKTDCPNELEETEIKLEGLKAEEIKGIAVMADTVCKGITEEDNKNCAKSCPIKHVENACKLYSKKHTVFGKEVFNTCTAVCMCQSGSRMISLKEAWAKWLESETLLAKEAAKDYEAPSCESPTNMHYPCEQRCPKHCKARCKSLGTWGVSQMCFCTPPKNGKHAGHMSLPLLSTLKFSDFCEQ